MFPERPTCHADDPMQAVSRLGTPFGWRPPRDDLPYRTCSYCGSIHPEDLLKVLEAAPDCLHGSD